MFEIGKIYSYPEICRQKNENKRLGNSKIKHIKEWSQYEIWEKTLDKYKFIRYKTDEEAEISILNKTYSELLELFLFSYLAEQESNKVFLTIPKCAEIMCLKNHNYVYGRHNQEEILELISKNQLLPINEEVITEENLSAFFNKTEPNYHRKIKDTLCKMQEMGLITYRKYLYLAYREGAFHRSVLATTEQEELLLNIGNIIIDSFPLRYVLNEIDGTVTFVKPDKTNLTRNENYMYYKRLPKLFIEELNNTPMTQTYQYYYHEYEIILSKDAIKKHIPYKLQNIKTAINTKVATNMRKYDMFESFIQWFIDIDTTVNIKNMIIEERKNQLKEENENE